jgi:hypothetical protein
LGSKGQYEDIENFYEVFKQQAMKFDPTSWIFPPGGTDLPKLSQKSQELHLFSQRGRIFFFISLDPNLQGMDSIVHPKEFPCINWSGVQLQQRNQEKCCGHWFSTSTVKVE